MDFAKRFGLIAERKPAPIGAGVATRAALNASATGIAYWLGEHGELANYWHGFNAARKNHFRLQCATGCTSSNESTGDRKEQVGKQKTYHLARYYATEPPYL